MANILAAVTGNWSDTGTWTGGVVPGPGDVAYANNKTVTIDVSITVSAISTVVENGNAAGGGFTCDTAGLTITADIFTGASGCLTTSNSSGTITINGNQTGGSSSNIRGLTHTGAGGLTIVGNQTGGSSTGCWAVNNNSSGTVTITGNQTGGTGGTSFGVQNSNVGTIVITGNQTGGSSTGAHGVNNNSTGTITITGNQTGGSGGGAYGVNNSLTGTITITGNQTGGSSGIAHGVYNNSTGTITITGIAYASENSSGAWNNTSGVLRVTRAVGNEFGLGSAGVNNVPGVQSNQNGSLTYVRELEFGSLGNTPVLGPIILTDATSNVVSFFKEGGGRKTLIDSATVSDVVPAQSDVRSGTVYDSGNKTGTCAVPAAGSVALGVPIDATTGTAVLTAGAIRSELSAELARMANCATVATTGQQIQDALNP